MERRHGLCRSNAAMCPIVVDLDNGEPVSILGDNALDTAQYLGILIEHEPDVIAQERKEAAELLGRDIKDEIEREQAIEDYVVTAGADRDADPLRLFHRRTARRLALLGGKPLLLSTRELQSVWRLRALRN